MIEDRKILDLKEAKYNLESFTYEMKNGLDSYGNYEHFIDPALKADFVAQLADTEAWIYGDGENAPLDAQRARLQHLQALGNPVKTRWRFHQDFEDYISIFSKYKLQATESMANIKHLTDENRSLIMDKCQVMETMLMDLRQKMETQPKYVDLPMTLDDLERRQIALENEVSAILATPAPAPKKPEEEKKNEETAPNDAEMRDETPAQE